MKAAYIPLDAAHPVMTRRPAAKGEWRFVDQRTGWACAPPAPGRAGDLQHACPRNGGLCGSIRVGNGFKPDGKPTWAWDGKFDAPTLTPSIHCRDVDDQGRRCAGCGWHGWLAAGEWREC
jgi:hypothetical protein